MGIIKESLNIDFEVINRPLTKEEEKMISDFISNYKKKNNRQTKTKIRKRNSAEKKQK